MLQKDFVDRRLMRHCISKPDNEGISLECSLALLIECESGKEEEEEGNEDDPKAEGFKLATIGFQMIQGNQQRFLHPKIPPDNYIPFSC